MAKLDINKIILNWECEECGELGDQALTDIEEAGTAICEECGDDMTLIGAETV